MRLTVTLLLVACAASLCARDRIAPIEFFGNQGIDVDAVRKALPFHEGDRLNKAVKDRARSAVKRVTGRDATDVAIVCCTDSVDSVLFIGVPGESSRPFAYNPAPQGDDAASRELAAVYSAMQKAEEAAMRKGVFGEDGAPGYRILKDPGARAAELHVRDYALAHEDELVRILQSSKSNSERSRAADALGYGAPTVKQMAALVEASRDPDDGVRNDATRALGEILRAIPSLATRVPPDAFIAMIRSGTWTDRNKAGSVLWPLTESRNPELLARLKAEAGPALLEMAHWRDEGWATSARMILGRIAGLADERILELTDNLDAFFAAIANESFGRNPSPTALPTRARADEA
jgi:hypothetical protein